MMKIIIRNTKENQSLLNKLGYICGDAPITSSEVKTHILIQGQRYYHDGTIINTDYTSKGWLNFESVPLPSLEQILQGERNRHKEIFDYLKNNLEVDITQTPLNIGREKLIISLKLENQTINQKVIIRETNRLGQQKITGKR